MAALLWYRPAARRSKTGATTTTPVLARDAPSASVVGPGHRLREVEERGVFLLAEVGRAEELGQADDLGALAGRLRDRATALREVLVGVRRHRHLDEADLEARGRHSFEV